MQIKMILAGAALGLGLASAASAQVPSALNACPGGTKFAETEGASMGPKMAATEGSGKGPKLAATEGAGKGPKLAATEGAGKGPKLASTEGMAVRLSNGVARMPDGTYCSPTQ